MFQVSEVVPVRRHEGICARITKAAVLAALIAPLAVAGTLAFSADAEAKGPGRTYCFLKKCHRVKTIAETAALVGQDMTVTASFYDSCKRDRYNPCGLTSSGEVFRPDRADNAASPVLPDGTIVLVWSPANREAVVVRINNAGPYWGNRTLDLSVAAARKLGVKGVGKVKVRVLKAPSAAEARYKRKRRYEPVPGPIGAFASLDQAHGAMTTMIAMGAPGTQALAAAPRLIASAETPADLAIDPGVDPATNLASVFRSSVAQGFAGTQSGFAAALAEERGREFALSSLTAPRAPGASLVRETSIAERPQSMAEGDRSSRGETGTQQTVAPARAVHGPAQQVLSKPSARQAKTSKAAAEKIRPAKRAGKSAKRTVAKAASPKTKGATSPVQPRRQAGMKKGPEARPAKVRSQEIDVGFTTYAEKRYQTAQKPLVAKGGGKPAAKAVRAKAGKMTPAAAPASSPPKIANRKPQPEKPGKAAAAKKTNGWQSSALDDGRLPARPEHHIGSTGSPVPGTRFFDRPREFQAPRHFQPVVLRRVA